MFQNLNETEKTKEEIANPKNILTNVISKKYIILYIVAFMISMVSMGFDTSPFAIAIIGACIANEIPIIAITVLVVIANGIGTGLTGTLNIVVTLLIFFASFFIKEIKYNDSSRNEKVLLAKRLFFASLIVNLIKIFMNQFLIYDLLVSISFSIIAVIFYKIFANSLTVITNFNEKMAFSIEEVLGTSLMLSIALCALGDFSILGFSVRNVLSIFIVLILGWKNGILIGTTAGATIGVTLGIIANNGPMVVAAYCISGMIAGILNKFGKFGVVAGFIFGNVILSYVANGLMDNLILFKEILIAGLGLLAIPKNINLNIENIIGENKFLPVGSVKGLNKSKETATKLNIVSKTLKDMASVYKDVAATVINDEDIREKNKQAFIIELLNNTEHMEENILYDNIENVDGKIVSDIFDELMNKGFIKEKDLINICAKNNNYVIGYKNNDDKTTRDIEKMTDAINSAFRIAKMNFIWSTKLNEEKSNFKNQLNGVSEAISNLADDIDKADNEEEIYEKEREQITLLLKQKNIITKEIQINRKEKDRYIIDLYVDEESYNDKVVLNVIKKVLNEKVIIKEKKNLKNENTLKLKIISADKYLIEMGHAIAIKDGMSVSGDNVLQAKLEDRKEFVCNK